MTALLRHIVQQELRVAGGLYDPSEPLPADLDAEAECVAAIIDGHATHTDLPFLKSEHFYSHILGAIWKAAEGAPAGDLEAVKQNLIAAGWRGALEEEIERSAFLQPFRSLSVLRENMNTILELYARRELIKRLQKAATDLRKGVVSADQARRELERWAKSTLGHQ